MSLMVHLNTPSLQSQDLGLLVLPQTDPALSPLPQNLSRLDCRSNQISDFRCSNTWPHPATRSRRGGQGHCAGPPLASSLHSACFSFLFCSWLGGAGPTPACCKGGRRIVTSPLAPFSLQFCFLQRSQRGPFSVPAGPSPCNLFKCSLLHLPAGEKQVGQGQVTLPDVLGGLMQGGCEIFKKCFCTLAEGPHHFRAHSEGPLPPLAAEAMRMALLMPPPSLVMPQPHPLQGWRRVPFTNPLPQPASWKAQSQALKTSCLQLCTSPGPSRQNCCLDCKGHGTASAPTPAL